MATSNGQYAPVFLPGEPLSLTEKPGRPQSTGLQRVGLNQSDPACIDIKFFFLPVAALPPWELSVKVVWLLGLWGPWQSKSYGPIRIFFQASCSWLSEGSFGQSFSVAALIQALKGRAPLPGVLLCFSACQAQRGAPLAGVLLYRSAHQSLKGAPWVGSCSVVQCIRCLMDLSIIQLPMLACGERLWWWLDPLCVTQQYHLASIAPSFPPQAFPTTVSSLTSPRFVSPQTTAALTLGLLHNP